MLKHIIMLIVAPGRPAACRAASPADPNKIYTNHIDNHTNYTATTTTNNNNNNDNKLMMIVFMILIVMLVTIVLIVVIIVTL